MDETWDGDLVRNCKSQLWSGNEIWSCFWKEEEIGRSLDQVWMKLGVLGESSESSRSSIATKKQQFMSICSSNFPFPALKSLNLLIKND
jgi:hypothetical protein